MARIVALKAAVMARPREDHCSAGLGASSDTVVYAERSRNFGDCSGGFRDGEVGTVLNVGVQSFPTMREVLHDVQADAESEDAEMSVEPAALSNFGVVTEMIGEGRVADVMCDGDDAGDQMDPRADEKTTVASADDVVNDGFGEAVRGGSGADVGRPSTGMVDDGVGGDLTIGAGLVGDEAGMGEPEGQKRVDGGYQRPAVPPGLRRRRKLRRGLQAEKSRSATPKPVSMGDRVTMLERSRVDEITRLNLYYAQSAAMFEYDGAMVRDLSTQLFRALARIDALEAAVMGGGIMILIMNPKHF
jgi:hypothetical protein